MTENVTYCPCKNASTLYTNQIKAKASVASFYYIFFTNLHSINEFHLILSDITVLVLCSYNIIINVAPWPSLQLTNHVEAGGVCCKTPHYWKATSAYQAYGCSDGTGLCVCEHVCVPGVSVFMPGTSVHTD